ncbi:MAG TPA: DNA N-6-adenine-methyltransferase [Gemmatimonadales bacterium]
MSEPHTYPTHEVPAWWTSDEWATPPEYFAQINQLYGPFTLDACATATNTKCARYWDREADGLIQPWTGRVWINPPYSDPAPWCQRTAVLIEEQPDLRVVMLLPAAVDTGWFHDWVLPYADIHFIRGRLRFHGWLGMPIGSPKSGNILALYPRGATW